jgi:hypothetical protein
VRMYDRDGAALAFARLDVTNEMAVRVRSTLARIEAIRDEIRFAEQAMVDPCFLGDNARAMRIHAAPGESGDRTNRRGGEALPRHRTIVARGPLPRRSSAANPADTCRARVVPAPAPLS